MKLYKSKEGVWALSCTITHINGILFIDKLGIYYA